MSEFLAALRAGTLLAELDLAHRCAELNRAGVEVARRAIARFRSHRPDSAPCHVLG